MRHFVLIRSAYGPVWNPEANRRRLTITAGITARSLATQSTADFRVVVLLDEQDPLLAERMAMWTDAVGDRFQPFMWRSDPAGFAPWDRNRNRVFTGRRDTTQDKRIEKNRIAATAYRVDWAEAIDAARGPVLMTRLDDDDGLHPTTLERVQRAARTLRRRTVLMHPMGFRVWAGRYSSVRHEQNAMHTLFTPDGDAMTVYDYGHAKVRTTQHVVTVDEDTAWLWVRHQDTISGWRRADEPLTPAIRELFPVDWSVL